MAWSIVTIFVVPVLVYEGLGPVDSIKKSVEVIKRTWGESLIKSFGLGLIQLFVILGIAAGAALVAFVLNLFIPETGILIGIGIGGLLIFLTALVFSVASTIFNTALYVYANKGAVAEGFNEEVMKGAFKTKK